jgi:acetyl esterase/lipase
MAGVMLSPWADLELNSYSMNNQLLDPFFADKAFFTRVVEKAQSLTSHGDPAHPIEMSFIHGEYGGLPPIYVTCGVSERLFDDSQSIVTRARQAGVKVEHEFHPLGVHNYPLLGPAHNIPEYEQSLDRICQFILKR